MPVTQRRCHHLQNIEPVVEVFTKAPLFDGLFQVNVGGCQYPHIDRYRLASTYSLDVFFLQKAQQVGLQLQGQVADFIEEQGAAISRLDPPHLALMGTSKGPFLVPEQL